MFSSIQSFKVLLSASFLSIKVGHNEGGDIIHNKLLAIQLRNPFSRYFLQGEIVRMPANVTCRTV